MEGQIIKTLEMKLREMYNYLRIPAPLGEAAAASLIRGIKLSKKPIPSFSELAVKFFKDKMDDKHTPLLLSVFCMIFIQVLYDPTVGCVTISKTKKEEGK